MKKTEKTPVEEVALRALMPARMLALVSELPELHTSHPSFQRNHLFGWQKQKKGPTPTLPKGGERRKVSHVRLMMAEEEWSPSPFLSPLRSESGKAERERAGERPFF